MRLYVTCSSKLCVFTRPMIVVGWLWPCVLVQGHDAGSNLYRSVASHPSIHRRVRPPRLQPQLFPASERASERDVRLEVFEKQVQLVVGTPWDRTEKCLSIRSCVLQMLQAVFNYFRWNLSRRWSKVKMSDSRWMRKYLDCSRIFFKFCWEVHTAKNNQTAVAI